MANLPEALVKGEAWLVQCVMDMGEKLHLDATAIAVILTRELSRLLCRIEQNKGGDE